MGKDNEQLVAIPTPKQKYVNGTVKGVQMFLVINAKIKALNKKRVFYPLSKEPSNDIQEITKSSQKSNNKDTV